MLTAISRGERLLTQWFIDHGHQLPGNIVLNEQHYALGREIVGVLRPLATASLPLESDAFKGSSVLPYLCVAKSQLQEAVPVEVAHNLARQGLGQVRRAAAVMPKIGELLG